MCNEKKHESFGPEDDDFYLRQIISACRAYANYLVAKEKHLKDFYDDIEKGRERLRRSDG